MRRSVSFHSLKNHSLKNNPVIARFVAKTWRKALTCSASFAMIASIICACRFAIDTYAHLTMAAGLLVPLSPTDEGNCGEYSKLQVNHLTENGIIIS